ILRLSLQSLTAYTAASKSHCRRSQASGVVLGGKPRTTLESNLSSFFSKNSFTNRALVCLSNTLLVTPYRNILLQTGDSLCSVIPGDTRIISRVVVKFGRDDSSAFGEFKSRAFRFSVVMW